MKARHALLRRQRELHGRLHDVRRPAGHLRRLGRAGRPGHPRRHDLRRRAASTRSAPTPMQVDLPSRARRRTCSPSSTATRSRSPARFQKIVNAGKNLHYPRTEPRVRVIPFFVGSERTRLLEREGAGGHRRQGADRPLPDPRLRRGPAAAASLRPRLQARPDERARPIPTSSPRSSCATSLGGRFGATPIDLSMPVMIAPMSYGALSKSTKIALAKASALSDICDNTGRGRADPRGARGRQARRRPVPRRPARLERPRHAPGRRRRDLHLAGREAGARRPADGEEGHARTSRGCAASRPASTCARRRGTPTCSAPTTS